MADETIIIDVQVNAADVKAKLEGVSAQIGALKNENVSLKKELKSVEQQWGANSKQAADLKLQIESNTQSIKTLTVTEKALQQQAMSTTQMNAGLGDSFKEQAALLTNLKNKYAGLSAEQRNSESGKALLKQMQDLDAQVKANDASMGNFQRNVGNYPGVFGKYGDSIQTVSNLFSGGFSNGLKTAGQSVLQFGKMLLTTPLGWIAAIIGVVVAALGKLKEAFKKNDDAGTKMSQSMAQLKPITEAISWIFDKLAVIVSKLVGGFMDIATAVLKLIPAYREAAKEAENLVIAEDKLEDVQRNFTVNSAKRQMQIAEINKKARSDNSLTARQREQLYIQADNLAKQDLADKVAIAKEELRILKAKAKKEVDTSDETKNKIAQAYRDWETDRKSTRLNSSHSGESRMPSSA